MEMIFLVTVAIAVLLGLSALNSATDQWDGCGCLLAVAAVVGILAVIAACMSVGWS